MRASVLVVIESVAMRGWTDLLLHSAGHHTVGCMDATIALMFASRQDFSLALMDARHPDARDLSKVEALRERVPLLMLERGTRSRLNGPVLLHWVEQSLKEQPAIC